MKKSVLGLAFLSLLTSVSAFAYGGYVAISYNPSTKIYGTSYGDQSYSEAAAVNRAVSTCDSSGGACDGQAVTTNYDGWVSLVTSDNGHWHMSPGATEADAEDSALAQCNAVAGDGSCAVVRSLSSFDYQPDDYGFKR